MARTVAVIGAGASGLTAIKCCLDEGLEPTCFERSDCIGGLWHYSEKVKEGHTTVMRNTIANVSKEFTAYSDFPPPVTQPIYMHNKDFEEYLKLYANKFDLKKHIQLEKEVVRIYETDDHEVTGRWNVKVKDISSNNVDVFTFDAVLICTGVFSEPNIPKYPGLDQFKGKLIHTHAYKDARGFDDKNVVVVGIGNSAIDAACDISHVSRQVYVSSRNGSWILGRLSKYGQPIDMTMISRFMYTLLTFFPSLLNKLMMKQCNTKIDHFQYGINPKYTPARSSSTVNDQLPYMLLIGAIKMKPDIKCFYDNDIEFVDGTRVNNVDAVVFGTGYLPKFPFLDTSVFGEDKTQLYLTMFPPDRQKQQTIAVIGCFRIKGPLLPIAEMQSRLATRVFKGKVSLPNRTVMYKDIEKQKLLSKEKRVYSLQAVSQLDFFPYMDQLAGMIGCRPNFWKMFLTDLALAVQCVFGPGTSYQFRLVGPGSWAGAREAIFTQWDRTYYTLSEGKQKTFKPRRRNKLKLFLFVCLVSVVFTAIYKYDVFEIYKQ
ncbi:flavin-containing monooxygenase 5-like isoform X2 [Ruditapes philippinarum]|nr:flavin-containing monooxygenase 5-like isoform X2 [Ruditapes philippinarum]XP_060597653.1 flavin-containing monooxygenase 5-like isoform X2 [Ruditapes philippinarum]XP_060597654.1 flavin-containing monooxygenase 5-like isoform X2 [Ruditapes philippinarum]